MRIRNHRRWYGENNELRAAEVVERDTFGHWQIDTIIGNGNANSYEVFLTLDESMIRKRHIVKLPTKISQAVEEGI